MRRCARRRSQEYRIIYKMIDLLSNHPRFVRPIVDAVWNEWGDDYIELTQHKTRESLSRFYEKTASGDGERIPIAYVCFEDDVYISSLLIDTEDMGMRPDLSPWLANVHTSPEHRKRGHASALIRHAIERHPNLYLWTFGEALASYYERFGFRAIEPPRQHGRYGNAIVMQRVDRAAIRS